MADSVRIRRVAEQIRAELAQILRDEVRDPRVGLVTVTRVKLAPDFGAATVFYSPLTLEISDSERTALEHAMSACRGFCRRELSKRVKLRKTPELRFVFDDSVQQGSETLDVIRSLDIKSDTESDSDTQSDSDSQSDSD